MARKAFLTASITGVAGILLLHTYLSRLEAQITGGAPVPIVVAATDTPLGSVLTETMLGVREVPQAFVEPRHIRAHDVERILGARVSMGMKAGEAVLWTDVASMESEGRDLAALVQDGMRAVSLRAGAAQFEGLLRPGDRVDVLFTADSGIAEGGRTQTLLQNIMVLAVGGDLGAADGAGHGHRRGRGVTLSLDAEQSQVLIQAETRGRLRLVLRNPNDIVIQEGLPATGLDQITGRKPTTRWRGTTRNEPPSRKIEHVR